ncbi:hypothetical protein CORC01_02388 [Colletotrichum orchidophilum]|uniref:Uncharacterized protein n=1 Tax=Colletotrichum orchidophilum TaxID=1209926 RepID=A0A1G4BM40_9PEZI|nr:uncharacterized protein CORC01_02388 [Colletotrichum orchidophilum]OHF02395.1 hypothetical protein CORC01_02388 [Colletotrichum orchidophilum]
MGRSCRMILADRVGSSGERPLLSKQWQAAKLKTGRGCQTGGTPPSSLGGGVRELPCLTFSDECSDLVRLVGTF